MKEKKRGKDALRGRWGEDLALAANLALLGLEDPSMTALRVRLRDAWGDDETTDDRGRRLLDLRGLPLIEPARIQVRDAHLGLAGFVGWAAPLSAAYRSYMRRGGRGAVRRLADANVVNCVFDGMSSTSVEEEGQLQLRGTFEGCSFRGARLTHANFGGLLRLIDCDFSNADLTRCNFSGDPARLHLFPPRYVDVRFAGARFARARLVAVPFLRCSFENAIMDYVSLERCRFVSCIMKGVRGRQVSGAENRIEDMDTPPFELRFPDEPLWYAHRQEPRHE